MLLGDNVMMITLAGGDWAAGFFLLKGWEAERQNNREKERKRERKRDIMGVRGENEKFESLDLEIAEVAASFASCRLLACMGRGGVVLVRK